MKEEEQRRWIGSALMSPTQQMEKVQLNQEQADLWMVCEEDEDEEELMMVSIHSGPAEEISSSQSSSVKVSSVTRDP